MWWAAWGRRALTCAIAGSAVLAAAASAAVKKAPLHWSAPVHVGHHGLSGLDCPSTRLCVAGSSDGLLVSTDPSGGPDTWKLVFVPPTKGSLAPQIVSVSCPATSFCAAASEEGDVVVSSNPGGGPSAWKLIHAGIPIGSLSLSRPPLLSCSSPKLCVAIASGGRTIVTSSDPGGGADKWQPATLRRPINTVACTTGSLCILGDDRGDVVSSTKPAGGAKTWHSVHIFGRPGFVEDLGAAACSSPSYCVIGALGFGNGYLQFASDPTGNPQKSPGAWRQTVAATVNHLFVTSACASGGFCISVDDTGTVYFPTRSYSGLTKTHVDHPPSPRLAAEAPACVSRRWCALASGDGNFYIGTG